MPPPDRQTADLLGLATYKGAPCEAGHNGERFTDRGTCVTCISDYGKRYRRKHKERDQARNRERKRLWKLANPDKVKAHRERYNLNNEGRAAALRKAARQRAADKRRELNKDKIAERDAARAAKLAADTQAKADKAALREARRATADDRRRAYSRAKAAHRRALARGSRGFISANELMTIRALQGNRCAYCGSADNLSLDHIIPISRGGLHRSDNFQFLCLFHNISKGASSDYAYRRLHGIPMLTPWDKAAGLYGFALDFSLDSPLPEAFVTRKGRPKSEGESVYAAREQYEPKKRRKPKLKPLSESLARFLHSPS